MWCILGFATAVEVIARHEPVRSFPLFCLFFGAILQMHTASLFFGTSVVAIAIGLESYRRLHDHSSSSHRELPISNLDQTYRTQRSRNRIWTNMLVALIGILAMVAGLLGGGPVWIALWAAIPLILVVIVTLAFADVARTHKYLREKLPEIQKESLGIAPRIASPPASQSDAL